MEPILVDTSVWIDWFKGADTPQTRTVQTYLQNGDTLLTTPTILQEVLQGVREDKRYEQVKESMLALTILRLDPTEAAIGAADLYRSLRKKGVTIRKANDCLIAYYALWHDARVVHTDTDFNLIAAHTTLRCLTLPA